MGDVVYLFKGGSNMSREISVFDVANTFLTYEGMTNKKLQKLCYYVQAWSWALYKKELFKSKFEAWVHGPVCRELYDCYKGNGWNTIPGVSDIPDTIDEEAMELIEAVFNTYGEFSGDELETLTHSEDPWKLARVGLEEWEPSDRIIDEKIMERFYTASYEQAQND